MAKDKKVKNASKIELKNAKGVFYKGVLWYYDTNADFLEAWPGFKLWMETEKSQTENS